MSMPLSISIILTKILISECAPKLGSLLFDPLTFDTRKDNINNHTNISHSHEVQYIDENSTEIKVTSSSRLKNAQHGVKIEPDSTSSTVRAKPQSISTIELPENKNLSYIGDNKNQSYKLRTSDGSETKSRQPGNENHEKYNLRDNDKQQTNSNKFLSGYEYDDTICKATNNTILCGYNKNKGSQTNEGKTVQISDRCHMRGDRIECGYFVGPYEPRRPPVNQNQEPNPKDTKQLKSEYKKLDLSSNDKADYLKSTQAQELTTAKSNTVTRCVEKDDRIVCYLYPVKQS